MRREPLALALALTLGVALAGTARASGPEPFPFAVFAGPADRPCAADVDGDGYADLLAFTPPGDVWVALSDHGQKCHGASVWAHGFGAGETLAAAADLDGDGRVDVVALEADGSIKVGVSDGKSQFVVSAWKCEADTAAVASLARSRRRLLATDVDGDGFADLVLLPEGQAPGEVLWLRNTGLHGFEKPARWGTAPADALAADLDGCGKVELAWWREGRVLVARLDASGKQAAEVWGEGVPGPLLAAGDVNGDGRADLVARGAWLLSHGTGVVAVADDRLAPNPEAAVSVGDLDGDGEGDVFVFERAGESLVRGILSRGPHWSPPEVWASLRDPLPGPRQTPSLVALPDATALVGHELMQGDGKLGARLLHTTDTDPTGAQAGDLDGDGIADLVRVSGHDLEWARGRRDGRFEPYAKLAPAPGDVFAVTTWTTTGRAAVVFQEEAFLLRDGTVWDRSLGAPFSGHAAVTLAAAPVTTPGLPDLVAFESSGGVLVAPATRDGWSHAESWSVAPAGAQPLWLADLTGDGRADLVAKVPGGLAVLVADARLHAFRQVGPIFRGPGEPLGLADLTGDGVPELLLRGPAGDLLVARLGGSLDRDADGITDRDEVRLYGSDPDERDTDRDGLLDGWEAHGFRGVRLDRMGASPTRRDLFLELSVEQTADMPRVGRALARMEKMFACAPIENPDGSRGISFHGSVAKRPPLWPDGAKDVPSRQDLREMFFTPRRAGLFHWMHLGARGGGGQADLCSDQGACAGVYECTLPHEFGHQIGLNHGGAVGTNGIPVYPSLMNYAYNYDISIGYSDGSLAGLDFDENALPEILDVPFAKLKYLSGGPFHFRVEPLEGGKKTWVDWNRDGVRDTAPVKANVNAIAGDGYGPRDLLDQIAPVNTATVTEEDPVLLDVAGALALLYVEKGTHAIAGRLLAADDDDPRHFGPVKMLLASPALDDITAVALGQEIHLFGTGADGRVVEARGTFEAGLTVAGVVSETRGLQASAVVRANAVRLFLRAPDGTISCEGVAIPGVKSTTPPGLAWETKKDQLLLVTTDEGTDRLRLTRLDPKTLAVISTEPVGGPHASDATNRRTAVLFETAAWLPPEGRIDIFHVGLLGSPDPRTGNTHMYRSYTIGDRAWLGRDGWKEDQTWNEWSYSTAGPGAALRHGRPWKVDRFWTPYGEPNPMDDHICVCSQADGICDAGLHDHDDWALIRDRGLVRSILHVSEPRGRLAVGK